MTSFGNHRVHRERVAVSLWIALKGTNRTRGLKMPLLDDQQAARHVILRDVAEPLADVVDGHADRQLLGERPHVDTRDGRRLAVVAALYRLHLFRLRRHRHRAGPSASRVSLTVVISGGCVYWASRVSLEAFR